MTQDIASKGLGVVYENCSSDQKKELVSVLVETLTTGRDSCIHRRHSIGAVVYAL